MRRSEFPFNGMQYLLNKNTGEIHDLDTETHGCNIIKINSSHIAMFNSYIEAEVSHILDACKVVNGCAFCIDKKHTD